MYFKLRFAVMVVCVAIIVLVGSAANRSLAWTSDNGDGTFTNPVLYGDYPDPDIIRVGSDFYLATTTFVSVPGLEILHSKDLINWTIAGYALTNFDISPKYSLIGGSEYGQGIWAPSLRFHDGTFYIVDNIQLVGTVVFRSTNPAGPWTMNKLNGYLFDPGLMFDDDGTPLVYNGTGGHISVALLDPSLNSVISNTPAFTMRGGEGSHAYKINGMYYVFNSIYGQYGVLSVSRSQSRTGPFTTVNACNSRIPWTSPHQGGIVQLANGDWWGFSLTDSGAVGRDLWIGPVTWTDGFPYFGSATSPTIPTTNPMPNVGMLKTPITHVANSDDFKGSKLGLQWQWNHNPDDTKWSLNGKRGGLRLETQLAPNFTSARNTLTLRAEGPTCTGIIKIDASHLQPGDRAGLSLLEQYFGYVAVTKDATGQRIICVVNKNGSLRSPSEDITDTVDNVSAQTLWFQVHCDFKTTKAQFSYSADGKNFTAVGDDFPMHFTLATFQGERFGIFNYNPAASTGWVAVDFFRQTD